MNRDVKIMGNLHSDFPYRIRPALGVVRNAVIALSLLVGVYDYEFCRKYCQAMDDNDPSPGVRK